MGVIAAFISILALAGMGCWMVVTDHYWFALLLFLMASCVSYKNKGEE